MIKASFASSNGAFQGSNSRHQSWRVGRHPAFSR